MSKDKIIGFILFIVSVILMILYTLYSIVQKYGTAGAYDNGDNAVPVIQTIWEAWYGLVKGLPILGQMTVMDAILLPIFVATMGVLFIFAWIGYTMFTVPPPEPIDLDELIAEEEAEKEEGESSES